MIRIAAIALTALCLAFPAGAKGKYEGIHTVAILAALGDVHVTGNKGLFNSSPDWSLAMPEWKLDDAATAKIAKLLDPRFTVKDVAYDHINFAKHKQSAFKAMFDESEQAFVKQLVLKLPPDNGVDAYIFVRPCWFTAQHITGSGLAVMRLWRDDVTYIFASYVIEVVDAKTGDTISQSVGHIGETSFLDLGNGQPVQVARIGKHWAPDREHFTAEHAANVRGAMLWMLDYSLPFTLYSLELTPRPDIPRIPFGTVPTPAPIGEATRP